ncbi:hypothetical protein AD941_07505 [Gluconobacter albidus]|uniref:Transposase n=1 Tax=Gluconobacter albidus TaxID=318683 RepID=A0AAW3QY62_9PROT|nr:hypothetical protein AD941_07505 [Gluconobacter albidus]
MRILCEILRTDLASARIFRHIATVLHRDLSMGTIRTHGSRVFWCPDFKDVAMRRFNQTQGILNHGNA